MKMLLPFRLRRFLSRNFTNYNHKPILGYDYEKHVPVRKRHKRYLVNKSELEIPNDEHITFVIICDNSYFILAEEQIRSIFLVEPKSEVFLFDAGLSTLQREKLITDNFGKIYFEQFDIEKLMQEQKLQRSEAMFFYKIIAVSIVEQKTKNKIIIYSDAANVFLKPLNAIKNFANKNGFYGGMTTTHLYSSILHHEVPNKFAEHINLNIYDNRFIYIEGGLWAIDTSHKWIREYLIQYKNISMNYHGIFKVFPHDMIAMSLLLYKFFCFESICLQELPNIRFNAIMEKKTVYEKNMLVYDYNIEKIPFFGYAVHNCSNHPDAPSKRKCTIQKEDILNYINLK